MNPINPEPGMPHANRHSAPTVDELRLAAVYAESVWRLAVREGQAAEFIEEFRSLVADVLDSNPTLEAFFRLSGFGERRRSALVERVFAGNTSPLLYNFLLTLSRNDRLGLLRAIGIVLEDLWEANQGMVAVQVRSAAPLSDDQLKRLSDLLASKRNIQADLKVVIDPTILGGMCVRVGDVVYDYSVRWNLNRLKDSVLARYAHEIQSGRNSVDH